MKVETPDKLTVLDHGYVEFIEPWGTGRDGKAIDHPEHPAKADYEVGIVEAARQSTQGSFRGWDTDQKLLTTLYTSKPAHAGPFEFAGMVLEVQAPIVVFREWHRHRTQSYNEMSARYAPLPDEHYVPNPLIVRIRADEAARTRNKQLQAADPKTTPPSDGDIKVWLNMLIDCYNHAEAFYQHGLMIGIPKELARLAMPVGHYSRMRCAANLRNWLAFMTLRHDPGAMWEIQQAAAAVGLLLEKYFPHTWGLYCDR